MARKINLANYIRNAVHKPAIKMERPDNTGMVYKPLYPSADENSNISEGARFQAAVSNGIMSSPTNIRRLFITYNRVYVEYYCAVKTSGGASAQYENSTGTSMPSLWGNTVDGGVSWNIKLPSDNFIMTGDNKKIFEPDGKIKNVITYPFAMSNIEEFYFDWSLFLIPDMYDLYRKIYGKDISVSDIGTFINNGGLGIGMQDFNELMAEMLPDIKVIDGKPDKEKFPRLRTIAYISNLETVINNAGSWNKTNPLRVVKGIQKSDELDAFVSTAHVSWLTEKKDIIAASNSDVRRAELNVEKLNKEFIVKSDMYLFDKKVLSDRVLVLKSYIKDYLRRLNNPGGGDKTPGENKTVTGLTDDDCKYIEDALKGYHNKQQGEIERLAEAISIKPNFNCDKQGSQRYGMALIFVIRSLRNNFTYNEYKSKEQIVELLKTVSDTNRDLVKKLMGVKKKAQ